VSLHCEGFRYFEFAIVPLALLTLVQRSSPSGNADSHGPGGGRAMGVGLIQIARAMRARFSRGSDVMSGCGPGRTRAQERR